MALTGDNEGLIALDAATGRPLGEPMAMVAGASGVLGEVVRGLAAADDSDTVLIVGEEDVDVWTGDPGKWAQQACRLANRTISRQDWQEHVGSSPYRPLCRGGRLELE